MAGRNFLSVQFMKTNLNLLQTRIFCAVALGIGSFFGLADSAKGYLAARTEIDVTIGSQQGAVVLLSKEEV